MKQAKLLTQVSRGFYNERMAEAGEYLCNLLKYDKMLPMNSGAEAVETAVKLARRWGYVIKNIQSNNAKIIATNNCFHGRSITLSHVSNDPLRYTNFGPFTPGFELVDYNDVNAIR